MEILPNLVYKLENHLVAKLQEIQVLARVSSIFSYRESILIQKRSAKKNIKFSNLDFFFIVE